MEDLMERSGPRCPWTREDCEIWKAISIRMGTGRGSRRRVILHNGDRRDAQMMFEAQSCPKVHRTVQVSPDGGQFEIMTFRGNAQP